MKYLLILIITLLSFVGVRGQTWATLGTGTNKAVYSLDTGNSYLYVGGAFDTAGGFPLNHIAKWDGATWSGLGGGINGDVRALIVFNGDLYAGGAFTSTASGPAANIAKWDGASWMPLGSGTDGTIYTLAVYNGNLYAGGTFAHAGGVSANNIGMWNGSSWSSLGQGTNDYVACMATYNGKLYIGGAFTFAGGNPEKTLAQWNVNSWVPLNSPQSSSQGPPVVSAMAAINGNLYYSLHIQPSSIEYALVTKFDGTSFTSECRLSSMIYGITIFSSELYFGGAQYQWPMIGKFSSSACVSWGRGQGVKNYGSVNTLISYKDYLYAGGLFDSAGVIKASNIARWTFPGVGIAEEGKQQRLALYPNPSDGLFMISSSHLYSGAFLLIRNVFGELVKRVPLQDSNTSLDLRDQKQGIYFYSLFNKNEEIDFGKLIIR